MLLDDDVERLLLEHTDGEVWDDQFYWDDWRDSIPWNEKRLTVEVVGLGTVEVWEHDFGGIETNVSYLMFKVGDRIFRKEGLWVSHDGQYWDGDFTEVRAVQKVITDYEEL